MDRIALPGLCLHQQSNLIVFFFCFFFFFGGGGVETLGLQNPLQTSALRRVGFLSSRVLGGLGFRTPGFLAFGVWGYGVSAEGSPHECPNHMGSSVN